ncbi:MAG: AraC family transcriptional regulator [Ruminococcus flavefaciens]|nr:AraC family transcriptional regulator [Ruminococcus flavefaciens]
MQEQIEAVQRMQDYIGAHLAENITLAALAKAAMYSPWYARRIFIAELGVTPSDYIRRLRLRFSALKLRDEKVNVSDIAFNSGFGSTDGYTRAFAREFGCTPKQYALNPTPLALFIPYGVKFKNIARSTKMQNTKNIFIQVIDKPQRDVIFKRGKTATEYWTYCNEVGCDVWGILTSIKSISGEPVCMWLPQKYIKPGTSEYVQGVEVPAGYRGKVPDGFEVITLPAAKYLMFRGEPFAEENFGIAIEEVQAAIKKYDPSVIGYKWDGKNPRIQLEPIGSRGYIELLPVK